MVFDSEQLKILFRQFCSEHLARLYHFGDADYFIGEMENYGCNPFIETEDDYKVKLGGFLESHLIHYGYTVHSELNRIYSGPASSKMRPDLTIHAVPRNDPHAGWTNDKRRAGGLRCVIELKGANLKHPDWDFTNGKIEEDIRKLADHLPNLQLVRCLVILDEGCKLCEKRARQLQQWVGQSGVLVLSNNPILNVN